MFSIPSTFNRHTARQPFSGYALGRSEVLPARVIHEDVQPPATFDHHGLDQSLRIRSLAYIRRHPVHQARPLVEHIRADLRRDVLRAAASRARPRLTDARADLPQYLPRRRLQRLRAPSRDRHPRAAPRQLDRRSLAQARPAARHQRDLARQQPLGKHRRPAFVVCHTRDHKSVARPSLPKRARWIAAGLLALLAALALGAYLYERHRTGSIYHPHARFIPQPSPVLPARGPARSAWPLYGYTRAHTRFFPAPPRVFPPFQRLWVHTGGSLLEFPPSIYGDHIFQLADDGVLSAINLHTGHTFWQRRIGSLSASTPAAVGHVVYATVLARTDGVRKGEAFALAYATGKILWRRALPSPQRVLAARRPRPRLLRLPNGTVYALNAHNGNVIWTYHAAGAVKASPTLSGGLLYFGDYSGHLQAISERTGRRIWDSGSGGALLGSGTFYSTAAVMYGRVFLGNTDGRVYAYDASTGHLDWAVQTGAYVYASPAVANAPGLGPTVYAGSYDGTFYALNARSGHIAWQLPPRRAHLRLGHRSSAASSTSPTSPTHRTYGLGISTGRVVFQMNTGSFDPVISDGQNIYLTGYTGLYGLAPR